MEPLKKYEVVKNALVGKQLSVKMLHDSSTEPDGCGGRFVRHYWQVVLMNDKDQIVSVFMHLDNTEESATVAYNAAVQCLS